MVLSAYHTNRSPPLPQRNCKPAHVEICNHLCTLARAQLLNFSVLFGLTFGGCGSAVIAAAYPELGIGFVGVALAFGLTVVSRPATCAEGHLAPAAHRVSLSGFSRFVESLNG